MEHHKLTVSTLSHCTQFMLINDINLYLYIPLDGAVALNLGANITGCLSVKISQVPKTVTFYERTLNALKHTIFF